LPLPVKAKKRRIRKQLRKFPCIGFRCRRRLELNECEIEILSAKQENKKVELRVKDKGKRLKLEILAAPEQGVM